MDTHAWTCMHAFDLASARLRNNINPWTPLAVCLHCPTYNTTTHRSGPGGLLMVCTSGSTEVSRTPKNCRRGLSRIFLPWSPKIMARDTGCECAAPLAACMPFTPGMRLSSCASRRAHAEAAAHAPRS
eukprot:61214-Chlamydomonas_euryale.AAC.1